MPLQTTPAARAGQIAKNLAAQANNLVKTHVALKANGLPAQAQTDDPAITAADYATAVGTANMAILDAMAAANPQT